MGKGLKLWAERKIINLYQGRRVSPSCNGPAAASLISCGIGAFAYILSHLLGLMNPEAKELLVRIGSWMPGTSSEGPVFSGYGTFSGEVTILIFAWLMSWYGLDVKWRYTNLTSSYFWGCFLLLYLGSMGLVFLSVPFQLFN